MTSLSQKEAVFKLTWQFKILLLVVFRLPHLSPWGLVIVGSKPFNCSKHQFAMLYTEKVLKHCRSVFKNRN